MCSDVRDLARSIREDGYKAPKTPRCQKARFTSITRIASRAAMTPLRELYLI